MLAVVKASETSKREELVAPLAGEVEKVFVQEGDRVKLGHAVVRIVQLGRVVVEGEMDLAGRASRDLIGKVEITPNYKDTFEFQGTSHSSTRQADANGNFASGSKLRIGRKTENGCSSPGGMAKLTILTRRKRPPPNDLESLLPALRKTTERQRTLSGRGGSHSPNVSQLLGKAGPGFGASSVLNIVFAPRGFRWWRASCLCSRSIFAIAESWKTCAWSHTNRSMPLSWTESNTQDPISPGAESTDCRLGGADHSGLCVSDDWKHKRKRNRPCSSAWQAPGHVVGRHRPDFSAKTDDDPEGSSIRCEMADIVHAIEIAVRPGAWAGPPGSLGLENIRRELIAFPHFHSPKVPANLMRLVQEHQPAAGIALVKLLESDNSTLHEAAAVVFGATWDSMRRKQIERYLLATMTHFVSKRSQYPQGVDARIGMGSAIGRVISVCQWIGSTQPQP